MTFLAALGVKLLFSMVNPWSLQPSSNLSRKVPRKSGLSKKVRHLTVDVTIWPGPVSSGDHTAPSVSLFVTPSCSKPLRELLFGEIGLEMLWPGKGLFLLKATINFQKVEFLAYYSGYYSPSNARILRGIIPLRFLINPSGNCTLDISLQKPR